MEKVVPGFVYVLLLLLLLLLLNAMAVTFSDIDRISPTQTLDAGLARLCG